MIETTRNAIITAAYVLSVAGFVVVVWEAVPEPQGRAVCPKVEWREVQQRGRIVRDTITEIPEGCR